MCTNQTTKIPLTLVIELHLVQKGLEMFGLLHVLLNESFLLILPHRLHLLLLQFDSLLHSLLLVLHLGDLAHSLLLLLDHLLRQQQPLVLLVPLQLEITEKEDQ